MNKTCTKCLISKDESEFSRKRKRKDGTIQLGAVCKVCVSIYFKGWAKENKEKHNKNVRNYKKKNRLKIKAKQYQTSEEILANMILDSNGKCNICKKELPLVIDHNHENGEVRSLLCGHCNRGIGMFFDDTELLKEAIKYLERFKSFPEYQDD